MSLSRPPAPASAPHPTPPFAALPVLLRPERGLLTYYALSSLVFGPFFIFALVPLYFRYHTLSYEIDDEGITMRRGLLFRREVSLNYRRIQDIHLSSNVVERWLGLAKIQVQTASGSAGAEMTIEGLGRHEAIRDFLYARMRGASDGARDVGTADVEAGPRPHTAVDGAAADELVAVLREVAAELRAVRQALSSGVRGPDA